MSEAVSDTGPLLHLAEISELPALAVFRRLSIPSGVGHELRLHGHPPETLLAFDEAPELEIVEIEPSAWQPFLRSGRQAIQPTDAQIAALAQDLGTQIPVLTDDLALRHLLEASGHRAIGSIGVLVRCYRLGRWTKDRLETAVDRLFSESTLHLGRAFRGEVRRMIHELP